LLARPTREVCSCKTIFLRCNQAATTTGTVTNPPVETTTVLFEAPLAKVKMDIHAIPFEDNAIDIIFCNHVLEHVDDDRKALSEIHRVLKPGGWAILQVPFFYPLPKTTYEDKSITDPKEREKAFGQDDHVRMYGEDYGARLAESGFQVVEECLIDELSPEEKTRFALPDKEVIYKVVK